jgi:uncharacterized protein YecT (DUF1311 family)
MRLLVGVVMTLVLAASGPDPVWGAEGRTDAAVERHQRACGEAFGFPGAVATCLLDQEKEYGAELARSYESLKRRETGTRATMLVESQRAWLTYQDTTCKLYDRTFAEDGANIGKSSAALCLLRTTLTRLEELDGLLQDGAR